MQFAIYINVLAFSLPLKKSVTYTDMNMSKRKCNEKLTNCFVVNIIKTNTQIYGNCIHFHIALLQFYYGGGLLICKSLTQLGFLLFLVWVLQLVYEIFKKHKHTILLKAKFNNP